MQFSKTKKEKMKKTRYRRIKKVYSNLKGCTICHDYCENDPNQFKQAEILDQTEMDKEIYILIKTDNDEIYIYKIAGYSKYVYVSNKKLIRSKVFFEKPKSWDYKTPILVDESGVKILK